MKINELKTAGKLTSKSRVGRGIAAGQGKTAGRGTKGQKARTGYKAPKRIPGMMSASDYRIPKVKGFRSTRPQVITVTLRQIEQAYSAGETVSPDTLVAKKVIVGYSAAGVKIVATGKLTKKVIFEKVALSKTLSKDETKPDDTAKPLE